MFSIAAAPFHIPTNTAKGFPSLDIVINTFFKFFYRFNLFIFREGKGGRKREKHQSVVAFHVPHTGDLACNPGMCPAWESNQQLFGSQVRAQSTEPHQPGLSTTLLSVWGFFIVAIQKLWQGLR